MHCRAGEHGDAVGEQLLRGVHSGAAGAPLQTGGGRGSGESEVVREEEGLPGGERCSAGGAGADEAGQRAHERDAQLYSTVEPLFVRESQLFLHHGDYAVEPQCVGRVEGVHLRFLRAAEENESSGEGALFRIQSIRSVQHVPAHDNETSGYLFGFGSGDYCVVNHIAGSIDDIHYKTLSSKTISIIGNEIRTESGFPEARCIRFVREYMLRDDEISYVFEVKVPSALPQEKRRLNVYIICSPFVVLCAPSNG